MIGIILTLSVGISQGFFTGVAIRRKFLRSRSLGEFLSISVLILFIIQAIIKITATSNQSSISTLSIWQNLNNLPNYVVSLLPHDFLSVISFSIPIATAFITWAARLHGNAEKFVTIVSIGALTFMGLNLLGFLTGSDVILLFIFYQIGVPIGILFGTNAGRHILRLIRQTHFPHL